jgi:hypothetical protein
MPRAPTIHTPKCMQLRILQRPITVPLESASVRLFLLAPMQEGLYYRMIVYTELGGSPPGVIT